MTVKIKPTVGRVVHYWVARPSPQREPLAAIVCSVISDTCVNLSVFDHGGNQSPETHVTLIQDGDVRPESAYCEWMPYQKQVAAGQIEPTLHKT